MDMYPPAPKIAPPTNPYSPEGVPDVAFTAEMDGQAVLTIDQSNPLIAPMAPKGVTGEQTFLLPRPGNNTIPEWFTQQVRLGYYSAVTHSDK